MPDLEALIADPDAAWLLTERLTTLRADDPQRLPIRAALARICTAGGDRIAAREHLEAAYAMALKLKDAQASPLRRQLALHLLSIGLPALSLPLLREALLDAIDTDDTLMIVSLGISLSAMRLEAADWAEAQKLGALVVSAASRRGNWLGVTDGLITQSTCLLRLGGPLIEAIVLLLHGGQRLNKMGSPAAVNLIKARLGELRTEHSPAVFDAALEAALARLQAPQPTGAQAT
ncbi:MAG: hypothetical protein P8R54_29565 [Myxococcota bacterium]|nr:hypothetical protein [Myxococcota bacterium]